MFVEGWAQNSRGHFMGFRSYPSLSGTDLVLVNEVLECARLRWGQELMSN